MAGIVFFYEDYDVDVFSGTHESLLPWNYACKIAGDIDAVRVINKTGQTIQSFDMSLDFQVVTDFCELSLAGTSTHIIGLSTDSTITNSLPTRRSRAW